MTRISARALTPSYASRVHWRKSVGDVRSPTWCFYRHQPADGRGAMSPGRTRHDVVVLMEGGEIVDARFGDSRRRKPCDARCAPAGKASHVDLNAPPRSEPSSSPATRSCRGDGVRRRGEERRTQRRPDGAGGNHDSEVAQALTSRRGSRSRSSSSLGGDDARRRRGVCGARSRKPPRGAKAGRIAAQRLEDAKKRPRVAA